jgi:hypothetical protein
MISKLRFLLVSIYRSAILDFVIERPSKPMARGMLSKNSPVSRQGDRWVRDWCIRGINLAEHRAKPGNPARAVV